MNEVQLVTGRGKLILAGNEFTVDRSISVSQLMKSIEAAKSDSTTVLGTILYLTKHWRVREDNTNPTLYVEYSATGDDPWAEKGRFF